MHILGISGSLQRSSSNLSLLRTAAQFAAHGNTFRIFAGLEALPHFNPDLDVEPLPVEVAGLRHTIAEADAVLIACPEYGHSLPGSLKNAIDWLIGSGELSQKVVGTTSAVSDKQRGQRGLDALRQTLLAVDAILVGGTPIEKGAAFESDVATLIRAIVERAVAQGKR
jgi:chromate reductase, NAD(P)H dehydrogenase (quinone)